GAAHARSRSAVVWRSDDRRRAPERPAPGARHARLRAAAARRSGAGPRSARPAARARAGGRRRSQRDFAAVNATRTPAARDGEIPADARFIAIEGPIGVGKTSLARRLAATWQTELLLEGAADNPFLPKFYEDPRRYALATQLHFL